MAIIASYFAGETYGLLGPQIAATVIQENTAYDCVVIAVAREDDKAVLKRSLVDYFGLEMPIIGFSTLSGREDLFSFAKELKDDGALTILAGPQADVDYLGEIDWRDYPHRFRGFSTNFNFSLHGPAEQAIYLLRELDRDGWRDCPGLIYPDKEGGIEQNPKIVWNESFLKRVRWDNIYIIGEEGLVPLKINTGQVVQQIGCPYTTRKKWAEIEYPVALDVRDGGKVKLRLKGCSFCDVAVDKGFNRALDMGTVLDQIHCLPEGPDGRKIPFELINENPLPELPRLLREIRAREYGLSQINLTLRADWLLGAQENLREALLLAKDMGVRILLSAVGFESFNDRILNNLNKGLTVKTNLAAVRFMRALKAEFPREWGYSRAEGAIHGFIHPTPWDTEEISSNIQQIAALYALPFDILPAHSTPLIIHHASGLGDWIREVERREGVQFQRHGSIIGWW